MSPKLCICKFSTKRSLMICYRSTYLIPWPKRFGKNNSSFNLVPVHNGMLMGQTVVSQTAGPITGNRNLCAIYGGMFFSYVRAIWERWHFLLMPMTSLWWRHPRLVSVIDESGPPAPPRGDPCIPGQNCDCICKADGYAVSSYTWKISETCSHSGINQNYEFVS